MSKDLRQYLQMAKELGPEFYVEVKKPLKPKLEVGVLQHKLAKEGRFPIIYCLRKMRSLWQNNIIIVTDTGPCRFRRGK